MNIATNTLKKLIAQWVRAWLPFTVVTKGGWLGFSTIQDAVDYCGGRGGGLVFIGPGTYNEAVDIADDYVNIGGCGMGVTKIRPEGAAQYGVKLSGDYCSASFMQIDTEYGAGAGTPDYGSACQAEADYGMFFRILNTTSDYHGFDLGSGGSWQVISHCIIPADSHDFYAVAATSPKSIFANNYFASGGGYNVSIDGVADGTTMTGNICDGLGATIYGIVISTNCENCVVVGNWVGRFLGTDVWERSGTSLVLVPDGGGPLNEVGS